MRYLTIVGLIFCLKIGVLASYTQPKYYTTAAGLSNNNINCILLTDRGFLWIGTKNGLYRYDSCGFINFRNIKGDTNSLSDNNITALAADSSSNVWIGTNMGLNHYNIKTMNFNAYYYNPQDSNSISGNRINDLYIDGNNVIWILAANVLNSIDIKKNRVHRYHIPGDAGKQDEIKLYTLEEDSNNIIWIGSSNGFYCFDKSSSKFMDTEYSITGYSVRSILTDNAGNLWLGTDHGLKKVIIEESFWRSRKVIITYIIATTLIIIMLIIYRKLRIKKIRRISQENENIAKQILEQKEELIAKNKNIMDSIKYAKRIQSALMPPETSFKSIFPDSFILHIPKDIVSGDFYWFSKIGDKSFIAAVDCTGHGVPGAFMSIIGIELFRNITNIEGIKQPAQILMTLNRDFQKIFHDKDIISFRDGMDLAFCAFDNKKMLLEYAGAFNPIYIIRNKNIYEYRGDRFSVGLDKPDENKKNIFKNNVIPMQDGDSIYIFSDGYADQFGGPDGKKYKYRRFQHLLLAINQLPMEKQHELLEKSIMRWKGDLDQVDDILVIGIRMHS
jgi:serine phosphatase RsbU (regulator of sigma subunit)